MITECLGATCAEGRRSMCRPPCFGQERLEALKDYEPPSADPNILNPARAD